MASESSNNLPITPKVSRRRVNTLNVRPKSAHEIRLDCCMNLVARSAQCKPNQGVTCKPLHYSLSEGSMHKASLPVDDSATLPLSLLCELSEVLNQLERSTLNRLALLLGLTQEQFNRLYHSTPNPARGILTQRERFVKNLDQLQQAFEELGLKVASKTITKYQLQNRNNENYDIFKTVGLAEVPARLENPRDRPWEKLDHGILFMHSHYEVSPCTLSDKSPAGPRCQFKSRTDIGISSRQSDMSPSNSIQMNTESLTKTFKEDQNIAENKTVQDQDMKIAENKSLDQFKLLSDDVEVIDSGFGSAEVFPTDGSLSINEFDSVVKQCHSASGYFDEEGGMLFIPDSSMYLRIPPGALTSGQQIQLTAVMEPGQDGCPRSFDCPRITPLVRCQPDGTTFLIPVELVLPHCGIIVEPDKVSVDVYSRHHVEKTDPRESQWFQDNDARGVLEEASCSIFLNHFSDYDVVVKEHDGSIIGKKLRSFPMINKLNKPSDDIILSLWMCNDYQKQYDELIADQTADHAGMLLSGFRSFMLLDSRQSVSVSYNNLSDGWRAVNTEETIGYRLLWHGSRGVAIFRLKSNTKYGGGKLNGTLKVVQRENSEDIKFELQREVTDFLKLQQPETNVSHPPPSQTIQKNHHKDLEETKEEDCTQMTMTRNKLYIPPSKGTGTHIHVYLAGNSPDRDADNIISPMSPPTFQVRQDIALALSRLLDPSNPLSNNWEGLAGKLGYTAQEIQSFEREKNPTRQLLLSACSSGRLGTYEELASIFNDMKRKDAALCLQEYCSKSVEYISPLFYKREGSQCSTCMRPARQHSEPFGFSSDSSKGGPSQDEIDLKSLPLFNHNGHQGSEKVFSTNGSCNERAFRGCSTPIRVNTESKGDSGFSSPVCFSSGNRVHGKGKRKPHIKLAPTFNSSQADQDCEQNVRGLTSHFASLSSSSSTSSSLSPPLNLSSMYDDDCPFHDSDDSQSKSLLQQSSTDDSGVSMS